MSSSSSTDRTLRAEVKNTSGVNTIDLELWVDDERFAEAHIDDRKLEALKHHLGLSVDDVREELKDALYDALSFELTQVDIRDLERDDEDEMRFHAAYTYRRQHRIYGGYVFYNVDTGEVGPDDVPAVVCNKMRIVVHRDIVGDEGTGAEFIDLVTGQPNGDDQE